MPRRNCGPNHPWRQYPNRRRQGPTAREIAVAEIMAEGDRACERSRRGAKPITAEEIAERLNLKPANVRNIMAQVRKRVGHQAC